MSRRLLIARAIIVCAIISIVSGCSSRSHSSLVPFPSTAGIQKSPQATGSWATVASMPTTRGYLSAGVGNNILYAVGGEVTGPG